VEGQGLNRKAVSWEQRVATFVSVGPAAERVGATDQESRQEDTEETGGQELPSFLGGHEKNSAVKGSLRGQHSARSPARRPDARALLRPVHAPSGRSGLTSRSAHCA